jgi:hypothetical protein
MQLELRTNVFCIIDEQDFAMLEPYKWYCYKSSSGALYAMSTIKGKVQRMHRFLLGMATNNHLQVDHLNHNTLDNRRCNLRVVSRAQNLQHRRGPQNFSSAYKGVGWHPCRRLWRVRIYDKGKRVEVGHFRDEVEAALAYDRKALEVYGEFAHLNFLHFR